MTEILKNRVSKNIKKRNLIKVPKTYEDKLGKRRGKCISKILKLVIQIPIIAALLKNNLRMKADFLI